MAPENRLALANVTMKLLTPLPGDCEAVEPAEAPRPDQRETAGDRNRQARDLHQVASRHDGADPIEPTERFMPPVASTTI